MAHENAHQWSGDLVTCAWWSDIWLNEGFATFIQSIGIRTKFNYSEDLFWDSQMTAMLTDSDEKTKPIVMPLVNSIDDILNGPVNHIIYEKGGYVLSMIRWIFGENLFRTAMQDYFRTYAYKSATTDDFLNIMEKYQQGLKQHMMTWIFEAGMPILTVNRLDQNTIQIQQNRFSYQNISSNTLWHIPIWYQQIFQNSSTATSNLIWMTQPAINISVDGYAPVIIINPDARAMVRVNYDKNTWETIIFMIRAQPNLFSPTTKAHLIDQAFAMVVNNRFDCDTLL